MNFDHAGGWVREALEGRDGSWGRHGHEALACLNGAGGSKNTKGAHSDLQTQKGSHRFTSIPEVNDATVGVY